MVSLFFNNFVQLETSVNICVQYLLLLLFWFINECSFVFQSSIFADSSSVCGQHAPQELRVWRVARPHQGQRHQGNHHHRTGLREASQGRRGGNLISSFFFFFLRR